MNVTQNERIALLNKIANEKEIYQSDLEEKETKGKSYRNILRQLHFLEEGDYIKVTTERRLGKKGPGKNILSLTFKGFWHTLLNCHSPEELEDMIKKHPEMLLITKKWSKFEAINIQKDVLEVLSAFLKHNLTAAVYLSMFGMKRTYPSDKAWQDEIDSEVLVTILLFGKDNFQSLKAEKWFDFLKLCDQDQELHSFTQSYLDKELKKYKLTLRLNEEWDKIRK